MNPDLLSEVSKVNGSLELIAMLLKIIGIGAGAFTAVIIYMYKRDFKTVDDKAEEAKAKAEKLEDEAKDEVKRIDEHFMSVQACNTRHS